MAIQLKKVNAGHYITGNGKYWILNYMGVWTVGDIEHEEDYNDFMTLSEAREFLTQKIGTQRLWVSDDGDVLCEDHAGTYLRLAIRSNPEAIQHETPLDNWCAYYTNLLGGGNLVCEVCVPWDSPNHPSNKVLA
jgi:hypothetical protein